jgi:UDP-glucose 4-epimerase
MRALVTGGAGYIGSHTVRELREAGHQVRVIDDLSKGHRAAVPPGVELVEGDLGDPTALRQALDGVDAVLHFAGLLSVGESVREPARYYEVNVIKGLALLQAMLSHGVSWMIFSSTCATYGMPVRVPMDEEHPQDPINPYGATKRAFERALLDHARAGQLRAVALRYFNAAGAHPDGSLGEDHRPEEHLIPLAIDACLGRREELTVFGDDYDTPDGTCIRDYIHVDDLCRAHLLALNKLDDCPEQVYNLGNGQGYSVREVIETVRRVSGKDFKVVETDRRPGDPGILTSDATKARRELGWTPEKPELETMVATAWKWHRDHPDGYPD